MYVLKILKTYIHVRNSLGSVLGVDNNQTRCRLWSMDQTLPRTVIAPYLKLERAGVSPTVAAKRLAADFSLDRIDEVLSELAHEVERRKKAKSKPIESHGGWIRRALEEDWSFTEMRARREVKSKKDRKMQEPIVISIEARRACWLALEPRMRQRLIEQMARRYERALAQRTTSPFAREFEAAKTDAMPTDRLLPLLLSDPDYWLLRS